ncbi:FBD-associated F-box protein-like protein [Salvia divinorum]|uniref:FBD-associated F-box protein-like protein n=1 Tax=Salvia divinorum TaxID=28513 RepID=A0ABD1H6J2_SALDI
MEEDRISQLPDDILLLILGKIDIFQAVETTILSHRWKNLWCLLPSLRFRFSHLVSSCLSHRDTTAAVHDFHLSFDSTFYVDRKLVEECVLYAINHGVQSLCLHARCSLRLPEAFISCKTLRELELRQLYCSVEVPGRLSLPNLKSFHLETHLAFNDDDIIMEPFSGLPELEKLTLIGYCFCIDAFVIKAPKLRVLEITTSSKVKEIHTPLLTSFRYESNYAWECANVNLPMLEQVYLGIHETMYCINFLHDNFMKMLHQLRNATTVSLTLDTLKVLERNCGPFEQTPSPFPNMKCLKVMEGRNGICAVFQGLLNYLTGTTLYCEVVFSPGVAVVEQISDEDKDNYEKNIAEDTGLYSDFSDFSDEDVELYSDFSDDNEDIELYSDSDEDIEFM